jgi:ABC-type glycerol-3-phosphate transport system substrate-binding protein
MQVGVGADGSQTLLETLILQRDAKFYKEDLTAVAFDDPKVLDAFKMWTGLYSEYDVPRSYDFFSYFRSGMMPLAIADYTQYNQFTIAAPEIKGLWSIYPIPGTLQSDGSINRTESSSGTASVLMKSAKNKEAAFSFLDWWSKSSTQTKYSRELEATMGPAARYNSANVETLATLSWKPSEYAIISQQWKSVWDIPSIPSSYYVTRNVTNAFRNVVYKNENERETLNKYANIINEEIIRKNEELGIVS